MQQKKLSPNQPHNPPVQSQNVTYVTQNIYVSNPSNFNPYMPPYMNPPNAPYATPYYGTHGYDPNFAYNYPNPGYQNYPNVPQYYSDPYMSSTSFSNQSPSPYNVSFNQNYPQTQQGIKPQKIETKVIDNSTPRSQDRSAYQISISGLQQPSQTQPPVKPRPIANDIRRSAPTGSSTSQFPAK